MSFCRFATGFFSATNGRAPLPAIVPDAFR
jgi:hypothetical protein